MPTFHVKRVNTIKTEQQNHDNNGLTPETESRIGKKTKQLQGPYGEWGNSLFFPQQRMLWSSGFCFCKRSMSMTS